MKKIILMMIFILAIVVLSSCEKEVPPNEEQTESMTESETKKISATESKTESTETTEDTEEGTESETEGWIYPEDARGYMNYPWKNDYFTSISSSLTELFPSEDVKAYFNDGESFIDMYERGKMVTVYDFIKTFNMKKDDFIKIDGDHYTKEEIEVMFSEDKTKEEVYEYFLAPHAIMVDTKVFGAGWLGTHNADDCRANGITAEMLEEKLPSIKSFMISNFSKESYKVVVNKIEKNIKELRTAG